MNCPKCAKPMQFCQQHSSESTVPVVFWWCPCGYKVEDLTYVNKKTPFEFEVTAGAGQRVEVI